MTNQRFYPGEPIYLKFHTSNNGNMVDPETITLKWKQTRQGAEQTGVITNLGVGIHQSIAKPTGLGPVHYRWEATNPDSVEEGTVNIRPGNFTETGFRDYG